MQGNAEHCQDLDQIGATLGFSNGGRVNSKKAATFSQLLDDFKSGNWSTSNDLRSPPKVVTVAGPANVLRHLVQSTLSHQCLRLAVIFA